ncbi:MAG: hypothetical protein HPY85_13000 [Anaerolineae bacterium]|nr:hypothetical protein [Anaerolineae bacterium]
MNRKKIILLTISAIFLMACACPLTSLFQSLVSPENIAESVIDAIPEDLTEQLPGEMDELLEELPEMDPEELEEFLDQPVPENIPILPERENDLYSMSGMITYSTQLPQADVEDFYRTEMTKLGWTEAEDNLLAGFALEFENETQTAQIILSDMAGDTYIMITIEDK